MRDNSNNELHPGNGKMMKKIMGWLQSKSRIQRLLLLLGMMMLLAITDLSTGFEYSFFIFYLFPVGLAVWTLDLRIGQLLIVLSVLTSVWIDFHLGCPVDKLLICRWNGWTTIFMFFVATYLLSRLKQMVSNLEELVVRRTKALDRESSEKTRLQEEILEITDREQQRIASDLHDIVCQHLTGVSLKTKALEKELQDLHLPQAVHASRISKLMGESIDLTRNCAEGLFPLEVFSENLSDMVRKVVEDMNQQSAIFCRCESDDFIGVKSQSELVELYRITLEAVRNAVKYSHANEIVVRLHREGEWVRLEIQDDGVGISDQLSGPGLGIRVMKHRAMKIGAVLQWIAAEPRGTIISCVWKVTYD